MAEAHGGWAGSVNYSFQERVPGAGHVLARSIEELDKRGNVRDVCTTTVAQVGVQVAKGEVHLTKCA